MRSVNTAGVEEVRIASVAVGVRRRKALGPLGRLKHSIVENGLVHPILVRNGNGAIELVVGARRLAACRELGWKTIPARVVDKLSDEDLREIELAENVERLAFEDYESSKQRLAEIRQIEAKKREANFGQETARKPGRPAKPGSQRERAKAAGVSRSEVRNLEKHVEIAEAFPFMKGWPQYRVLEAGEGLAALPEKEHSAVAVLLDQEAVPAKDAVKIINNLASNLSPEERKQIYAAAKDPDPHRRGKALSAAAALPASPPPLQLFAMEAVRSIEKGIKASPRNDPEVAFAGEEVEHLKAMIDRLRARKGQL